MRVGALPPPPPEEGAVKIPTLMDGLTARRPVLLTGTYDTSLSSSLLRFLLFIVGLVAVILHGRADEKAIILTSFLVLLRLPPFGAPRNCFSFPLFGAPFALGSFIR